MSDRQQERKFGRVLQPDPDRIPSGRSPEHPWHPDPCFPDRPGRPRDDPFTYVRPTPHGPAFPIHRDPNDIRSRPFPDENEHLT